MGLSVPTPRGMFGSLAEADRLAATRRRMTVGSGRTGARTVQATVSPTEFPTVAVALTTSYAPGCLRAPADVRRAARLDIGSGGGWRWSDVRVVRARPRSESPLGTNPGALCIRDASPSPRDATMRHASFLRATPRNSSLGTPSESPASDGFGCCRPFCRSREERAPSRRTTSFEVEAWGPSPTEADER